MTLPPQEDHRTRVGLERRARMRQRLIEAATLVFAKMGPEVAQIDDVIRQAGVSRGTFYNYFRSTDDLLRAAVDALSVALVSGAGDNTAQPAERFADRIKAFVDLATRPPLLLDFVSRLGVSTLGSDVLTPALAAERMLDVIAPEAAGDLSRNLARGIVDAAILALLLRVRVGTPVDIAGFVAAMLRALGHPPAEASRLAARPITPLTIPTDSLIIRSLSARSRGAELGRKPG